MEKNNHNTLITGAILGGTLGLLAARQLAEKNHHSYDYSEEVSHKGNAALLASACTLLGVGAGLLFAPKSGKELREDITDIVENFQEKTSDLASNITEQGSDFIHNFSDQASDLVEKAKHMAGQVSSGAHKGRRHAKNEAALSETLENAINMANIGFRLWNTLTKGR